MKVTDYFIIFTTYSIIGYFLEIAYIFITSKLRHIPYFHRNYSWLPISPPYGFGALILIIYLQTYISDAIIFDAIFCGVALSLVEYVSAVFCERCLHQKFWDYSKLKFNYKSRVSLLNSICYVFAGLLFIRFFYTPTMNLAALLPETVKILLLVIDVTLLVINLGNRKSLELFEKLTHRHYYHWGNGGL